jgi:hypothetical protein
MKIKALTVTREENGGNPALMCTVTWADGTQSCAAHPWRNPFGIWASPDEARDPNEICAVLRNFARAIEDAAKERAAA